MYLKLLKDIEGMKAGEYRWVRFYSTDYCSNYAGVYIRCKDGKLKWYDMDYLIKKKLAIEYPT